MLRPPGCAQLPLGGGGLLLQGLGGESSLLPWHFGVSEAPRFSGGSCSGYNPPFPWGLGQCSPALRSQRVSLTQASPPHHPSGRDLQAHPKSEPPQSPSQAGLLPHGRAHLLSSPGSPEAQTLQLEPLVCDTALDAHRCPGGLAQAHGGGRLIPNP